MAHTSETKTEAAPEPHGATPESRIQSDDIQVGFIALMTISFAGFLLVSLIGLEAFFYNSANTEARLKMKDQGSKETDLGQARQQWNTMLNAKGNVPNVVAPGKEGAAGNVTYPKINVVPIDAAMNEVINANGPATGPGMKGSAGGSVER